MFISSFLLTQKDMLESILRVTQTSHSDWKVTKEPSHERRAKGVEAMQNGDMTGFIRMMYTRVFYPDDTGNHGKTKGLSNDILNLPQEDLDEATKAAIKRAKDTGVA